MAERRSADECATMTELRAAIDRLDADLIALFAERMGYIRRAAVLKMQLNLPADIPERVAEVIGNVGRLASEHALDHALYEALWRRIVNAAIAEEERLLPPRSGSGAAD